MHRSQQGFTLIELLIVVFVVGVLSAVALPVYRDYTVRAKVSEVVLAASALRSDVAEYAHANGTMPGDSELSGVVRGSRWVASVIYSRDPSLSTAGVVTATAQGDPHFEGAYVAMRGSLTPSGQVDWRCEGTIAAKYLPAACR
ncbi:MAG: pilin [Burkholderiales bacterium]|nr:pilin [Burkholderiales bacterium]